MQFRSQDPDHAAELMAAASPGCRFEVLGRSGNFFAAEAYPLPGMSAFKVDFGHWRVQVPPQHGYFGVTVPLRGRFDVRTSRGTKQFEPGSAHILDPGAPLDWLVPEIGSVQVFEFAEAPLRRLAEDAFDQALPGREANTTLPLNGTAMRAFWREARLFWRDLQVDETGLGSAEGVELRHEGLATALLSALLDPAQAPRADRFGSTRLARARDFIHANLHEPVSVAEIAAAAGVTVRTLSRAFQAELGTAPMAHLRDLRLQRANLELAAAQAEETTVTDVAMRYCFFHLSRFAAAYKRAFGEPPSATLRR